MDPVMYEESRLRFVRLSHTFSIGALVMTIMLASVPFVAIGFACLSILFALISKGYGTKLTRDSRASVTTSVIAILVSVGIIVYSFVMLATNPEVRQSVIDYANMLYGEDYEEMLGFSFEDLFNGLFGGLQ